MKKLRRKSRQRKRSLSHQPPPPPLPPKPTPKLTILRIFERSALALTLLTGSYGIYDLWWQARPTVDVSSSQPTQVFGVPFVISTQSNLFDLQDMQFECRWSMKDKNHNTFNLVVEKYTKTATISRQKPVNFFCRSSVPSEIVTELSVEIVPSYCISLFSIRRWCRTEQPTEFTWINPPGGAGGYWMKGLVGN